MRFADRDPGLVRELAERRRARERRARLDAGLLIRFEAQSEWLEEDARSAADWLADHYRQAMQVDSGTHFMPRARLWLVEDIRDTDDAVLGWHVHLGNCAWPLFAGARCWRFTRHYSGGPNGERWPRPTLLIDQDHPELPGPVRRYFVMACGADPDWVADEVQETWGR